MIVGVSPAMRTLRGSTSVLGFLEDQSVDFRFSELLFSSARSGSRSFAPPRPNSGRAASTRAANLPVNAAKTP